MKRFRLIAAFIAIVAATIPASAQLFRYGIRAGINVNSLHLSKDLSTFDSHNRLGYTLGVTGELNIPVLPFSVDASLMFTRNNINLSYTDDNGDTYSQTKGANYFEIPVNVRWNISIPAVSAIIKPYIFTGPNFAFLMSKRKVNNIVTRSNRDIDWRFGLGVELVRHLQLSASYALGISKAYKGDEYGNGKNRYWSVTAAYMF